MGLSPLAADGFCGANPDAQAAALTELCHDFVAQEALADASWTALFVNMGFVFIPEILDGAQSRIWGALAQAAEGCAFDEISRASRLFDISILSLAIGEAGGDFQLSCGFPTLQGVHLPQDSSWVNSRKERRPPCSCPHP